MVCRVDEGTMRDEKVPSINIPYTLISLQYSNYRSLVLWDEILTGWAGQEGGGVVTNISLKVFRQLSGENGTQLQCQKSI